MHRRTPARPEGQGQELGPGQADFLSTTSFLPEAATRRAREFSPGAIGASECEKSGAGQADLLSTTSSLPEAATRRAREFSPGGFGG